MSLMPRARATVLIAALLGVSVSITGCTTETSSTPIVDTAEKLTPLWEVANDSISASPVVVGDSVVVLEQRNGAVTLVGYAIADGTEAWAHESTTGSVKTSTRLTPTVVESADGSPLIGMLTPPVLNVADDYWEHSMVLLDPDTGETVAESPRFWASTLSECERALCANAWNLSTQSWEPSRLSIDGTFVRGEGANRRQFDGLSSRPLAADLYLTVDAEGVPAELIVTAGDGIVKRTPASDVLDGFEGNAMNLLGGAHLAEADDVFIVSSTRVDTSDSPGTHYGASDFVNFGIDRKTGDLLWQGAGYLPCALDVGIYCTGTDAGYTQEESSSAFTFAGGETTLVKIDPLTGEEEWTYQVTDFGGVGNGVQDGSFSSPHGQLAFTDNDVPMLISVESGEAVAMKTGDLVGCFQRKSYSAPEDSNPRKSDVTFDGAFVTQGCGPDGDVTEAEGFTAGVASGGVQKWLPHGQPRSDSDRFYVVQAAGKLLAYQF